MTTIELIEAAAIPTTPVNPNLRSLPQKERSAAIWKLLRVTLKLGRGVSVTSDRGSMCFGTSVTFEGVRCDEGEECLRRHDPCPASARNIAADRKLEQIILAAFPDMDDRSDSQSDHFDCPFSIHVTRPELAAKAAEPAREETSPDYVAVSQVKPVDPELERKFFGNAADIWTACRDIEKEDREHFVVFFLDVRHRLMGQRWTAAIGTAVGVECGPREVYREALLRGAVGVIIAHNHPSGDPTPSRQDIEITRRFRGAAEMLGLNILDHIVVGDCSFVSLASRGWM
jgi:hypothetical protein